MRLELLVQCATAQILGEMGRFCAEAQALKAQTAEDWFLIEREMDAAREGDGLKDVRIDTVLTVAAAMQKWQTQGAAEFLAIQSGRTLEAWKKWMQEDVL